MPQPPSYILLGTYNGAKYIEKQIESIQGQSVEEWILFVRDDGSKDDTVEILSRLQGGDRRIRLLSDNSGHLGTILNYAKLMTIARDKGAMVVFFSDQDDVWLPDKLKRQLECLDEMESRIGSDSPILVHSDLTVVDEDLNVLNRSFMDYQGVANEERTPLNILLAQNYITGCATGINRSLLELALPIPDPALMHDWWLSICAAAFGKIAFIETPTVLYRQHDDNRVGAKEFRGMLNPLRTNPLENWRFGRHTFLGSIAQAKQLSERINSSRFSPKAGAEKLSLGYASCLSLSRLKRLTLIRHLGIRRQGMIRQAIFYLRLLFAKRTN
jgi:glycosyltransferase involved in cell wall biosynthesis